MIYYNTLTILGWPKIMLDFSVKCYRKTKANFLAKPIAEKKTPQQN